MRARSYYNSRLSASTSTLSLLSNEKENETAQPKKKNKQEERSKKRREKMCCSKCVVKCNMRGQAQATNEWRQVTANRPCVYCILYARMSVCIEACILTQQTTTDADTKLNTLNRHSFTSTRFFSFSKWMNEWTSKWMNEKVIRDFVSPFSSSSRHWCAAWYRPGIEFYVMPRHVMNSRSTGQDACIDETPNFMRIHLIGPIEFSLNRLLHWFRRKFIHI